MKTFVTQQSTTENELEKNSLFVGNWKFYSLNIIS